jgi:hypothetical protein
MSFTNNLIYVYYFVSLKHLLTLAYEFIETLLPRFFLFVFDFLW